MVSLAHPLVSLSRPPSSLSSIRMLPRHILSTLTSIVFFVVVTGSVWADDADVPGAPRLLPERTIAYLRIEDVNEFRTTLAESSTGRMLADPKLKSIASDFYQTGSDLFATVAAEFDISLSELLAIPKGQLAIAVIRLDDNAIPAADAAAKDDSPDAIRARLIAKKATEGRVGVVLIVETGSDDKKMKSLLDKVQKRLTTDGWVLRTEKVGATTLVKNIRADDENNSIDYFSREGATIIGFRAGAARSALDHWNGTATTRSLAESTDFASVMSRCVGAEATRPQITFFANPFRLVELIFLNVSAGGNIGAALGWPILQELGIQKIRGIGGSVFQGGETFEDITHVHLLLDPPRDGIFGVIRPADGDPTPPSWVPSDVASYRSIYWRFDKSFDGFEKIWNRFAGENAFQTTLGGFEKRATLSMRDSIISEMTGRIVTITWMVPPLVINSESRLLGIEFKDADTAKKTFDVMVEKLWPNLVAEGSGSNRVFRNPRGERPPREGFRRPEPCFAFVGNWFILSDSDELLQRVIRSESGSIPSLVNVPDYALVSAELGAQLTSEKPFMFSFTRNSEALRPIYEQVKSPRVREFARSQGENNPVWAKIADLVERNELPPFEEFKKYFAPTGSFAYDESDGMHLGRFTLRAE